MDAMRMTALLICTAAAVASVAGTGRSGPLVLPADEADALLSPAAPGSLAGTAPDLTAWPSPQADPAVDARRSGLRGSAGPAISVGPEAPPSLAAQLGYELGRTTIYASAVRALDRTDATASEMRGWRPGAGFDVQVNDKVSLGAEALTEDWNHFALPGSGLEVRSLGARLNYRF